MTDTMSTQPESAGTEPPGTEPPGTEPPSTEPPSTEPPSTEAAYATCAAITRREARNFAYGIALLPKPKRQAMTAVYSLARRIDDIGDGDLPTEQKQERLDGVRDQLHHLSSTPVESVVDPVLHALADAARRLPLPLEAFDELIDGCMADVLGRRYQTSEELAWYCRCVAGSVGRLSVGVYDPSDRVAADALANTLGMALQLTNILRDLREDRLAGRVYLPAEDLERFDCRLELDEEGRLNDPTDRFAALVRYEAERAECGYRVGLQLLPLLDHRSAACTAAMAGIYRRLLRRIAADPEQIRGRRLSLPGRAKLGVATRAIVLARA